MAHNTARTVYLACANRTVTQSGVANPWHNWQPPAASEQIHCCSMLVLMAGQGK
jgi:hypothetical protein